jgi:hypothetical protein
MMTDADGKTRIKVNTTHFCRGQWVTVLGQVGPKVLVRGKNLNNVLRIKEDVEEVVNREDLE